MWVEAGFVPETFWRQTQRSFSNALAGAAKRRTIDAWRAANLIGSASVGKLPKLEEILPSDEAPEPEDFRLHNAKLLNFMFKLKAKGIPMTIERLH